MIEKAGYGEYFVHRTGHGIGMEAHEDPYMVSGNKLPIEAGHAFSVEPGIYIREEKLGIRLENNVLIGEKENVDLMKNIPIEAEEIEELMNS